MCEKIKLGMNLRETNMFDPLDPLLMLTCFCNDEDLTYPYCRETLTVTSQVEQVGAEIFQCCECSGAFTVNWEEEKIYYS